MHRCEECDREFKSPQALGRHNAAHRAQASKTHKRCPRCGLTKAIEQFPISKRHRMDGRYPYCLTCKSDAMREANTRYRENHPIDHARYQLNRAAKRLGISVEAVQARLAEQGGVCAICGGGPTGNHGRLVIDHNHQTGEVRGLLCGLCNTGLGALRDRLDLVIAAADYLRRYGHHEGE